MTIRTILGATSLAALLTTGAALAATPEAGETLAEEQTFTYNVIDEIVTLDPGLLEVTDDADLSRNLFEGLMSQDPEGVPVPGVATGYEVSEDGLTWTFALRPEAKWSNGDPVTAADFVYAWRRAVDPATASPYSWFIELMQVTGATDIIAGTATPDTLGVEATDKHTFVVRLTTAVPYLDGMVTNPTTFPVHQASLEEFGDQWTQPGNLISNGAYTLSERVPQERIVLTRNPNYWDDAATVIETVTTLIITDEGQALTRWRDGEVDKTAVVPAGQFPALAAELPDETVSVPNMCTYYYQLNVRPDAPAPLLDQRVREALNLAIDRDVIVNAILAGGQVPAYTLTHWATAGWEAPEVPAAAMTQDERNARAKELMAEAGFGEGAEPLTFEIIFNTSESHQQIAVAVGQMWKQTLGVETTLANQEWQTFLDTRKEGAFEIARAAWCADYNEASSFLDIMTVNSEANDSRYANPEFDAMMDGAVKEADPLATYQAAEVMLARDVPILPIYFYASNFMLDAGIKGWPYENAQQNWYAKDLYRVAGE